MVFPGGRGPWTAAESHPTGIPPDVGQSTSLFDVGIGGTFPVILCDMEANRLHHIRFDRHHRQRSVARVASWPGIAIGAAVGMALGLGISYLLARPI